MPGFLFPEILCLTITMKYQRIFCRVLISELGNYPLSCLNEHNSGHTRDDWSFPTSLFGWNRLRPSNIHVKPGSHRVFRQSPTVAE